MPAREAAAGIGTPLPFLKDCVYLDYNATTPVYPEVGQEMLPFLTSHFGNPSSSHAYGRQSKEALDLARERLAAAIGAAPDEVYFTSCGTESDNWAIMGAVEACTFDTPHVVTTSVEHPAVIQCLQYLQDRGEATFSTVGVDCEGVVDPEDIVAALRPETCLVTVMHCNNEIGSVQPVAAIAAAVRRHCPAALLHTDAAQSLGKVAVDVHQMGIDMATFVGHKIGGPKGVAALYIRSGVKLPGFLHGGGQERGMRGGTESMVLLSGFGKAAELLHTEGEELQHHMRLMRDRLQSSLQASIPKDRLRVNGPADDGKRAANTLSVSIKGINASLLLLELQDTVAASAGAACKQGEGATLSGTLKAIQVPAEFALGTIRLSVGRHTTLDEVDAGVRNILQACSKQGVPVAAKKAAS